MAAQLHKDIKNNWIVSFGTVGFIYFVSIYSNFIYFLKTYSFIGKPVSHTHKERKKERGTKRGHLAAGSLPKWSQLLEKVQVTLGVRIFWVSHMGDGGPGTQASSTAFSGPFSKGLYQKQSI